MRVESAAVAHRNDATLGRGWPVRHEFCAAQGRWWRSRRRRRGRARWRLGWRGRDGGVRWRHRCGGLGWDSGVRSGSHWLGCGTGGVCRGCRCRGVGSRSGGGAGLRPAGSGGRRRRGRRCLHQHSRRWRVRRGDRSTTGGQQARQRTQGQPNKGPA